MIAFLLPLLLMAPAVQKKKPAAPAPAVTAPPASIDGLPIGGIGRQSLPAKGCAAYLFSTGQTRTLAAMAGADPASLRLAIDGISADYARTGQSGAGGFGFAGTTEYRGGDVTATLDMAIETRGDLTAGAAVPQATLRVDRPGKDTIVMPLAGLVGCRA